jgi:nickel transport protein
MFRIIFLVLLGCISAPLLAHDLWIERDGLLHTLSYGHERSGHEGAKRLEYQSETVLQAVCISASGREMKADHGKSYPVTLKGDCAASWFLVSSGYWSKTPYGTKNLPKSEAGAVMDSWLSVEAVKRIDRWSEALTRPLGKELELVPVGNPLTLNAGDKLRLRAFHQANRWPT